MPVTGSTSYINIIETTLTTAMAITIFMYSELTLMTIFVELSYR